MYRMRFLKTLLLYLTFGAGLVFVGYLFGERLGFISYQMDASPYQLLKVGRAVFCTAPDISVYVTEEGRGSADAADKRYVFDNTSVFAAVEGEQLGMLYLRTSRISLPDLETKQHFTCLNEDSDPSLVATLKDVTYLPYSSVEKKWYEDMVYEQNRPK